MDLGGRWSVLEKFIAELSPSVFYGIQALLFVVDVVEEDKFDSAKSYFDLVLQKIRDYSPSARIFVFLNKIDRIPTPSERQKTVELLRRLFQEQLEEEIVFYETTIHDNSAKAALFAIFKKIMPEAASQIEEHLQERISTPITQGAVSEVLNASVEPVTTSKKALNMGSEVDTDQPEVTPTLKIPPISIPTPPAPVELESEVERDQSEITQPLEIPSPPIPTPPAAVPPINLVTEPSSEGRDISVSQFESTKGKGVNRVRELRELLDQMREALKLSVVSLVAHDGRTYINPGENIEQFSESITIVHRVFEATLHQVPEGLEQLIIEMSDSFVTINQVDESFVLITTGYTPPVSGFSQKLVEFAREVASHTQRLGGGRGELIGINEEK